ncbi:hypothetical protein JAAARDRAFT_207387 [Jaapia argillacea MUCL 33604]|uniref:Uncharacterized protein n=1 Tax=Jaapia argillacea MUCL 33604 TaxID=933084 RepID=A0A067Q368_9AGAM|nr:hypothetical protein JAAARDRAFT_207387 [Jaapia argillacea MUCL 33604]
MSDPPAVPFNPCYPSGYPPKFSQLMTEKLAYFIQTATRCSAQIRPDGLDKVEEYWRAANSDWNNDPIANPTVLPPMENHQERTIFFDKCNKICELTPQTPLECIRVIMAANNGAECLMSQDLYGHPEFAQIVADANMLVQVSSSEVVEDPEDVKIDVNPEHGASQPTRPRGDFDRVDEGSWDEGHDTISYN